MNVKLLRKIQRHILAEPKRFIMGSYIQRNALTDRVIEYLDVAGGDRWDFPACGTAGCIAGWAVLLSNPESRIRDGKSLRERATKLLGIEMPFRLFTVAQWPRSFAEGFMNGKTPLQRAKVAAARIDHFIATKGAE